MSAIAVVLLGLVLCGQGTLQESYVWNETYVEDIRISADVVPKLPESRALRSFPGSVVFLGQKWKIFEDNAESRIADVSVSCLELQGIVVTILFTEDFSGLIYPDGEYGTCDRLTYTGHHSRSAQLVLPIGSPECSHSVHIYKTSFAHFRLRVQWHPLMVTEDDLVLAVTCSDPANSANLDYGVQLRLTDSMSNVELTQTFPGSEASLQVTVDNGHGHDVSIQWCLAHDGNAASGTAGYLQVIKDNCPAPNAADGPFGPPMSVSNGSASTSLTFHFDVFGLPTSDHVIIECSINICDGVCPTKVCTDEGDSVNSASRIVDTITLFQFYYIVLPTISLGPDNLCPTEVEVPCPQESEAGAVVGFIGLGIALTIISYFLFQRFSKSFKNAEKEYEETKSHNQHGFMDAISLHSLNRSEDESEDSMPKV